MAFEVDLEELQREDTLNAEKILNEFFSNKNINVKTQIDAPAEFTTLDVIAQNFNSFINIDKKKKHTFKKTPKTLKNWMELFKEYMISNGRASRHEVADVLKAMKQQERESRGILQRLTGIGKEK